MAKQSVLHNSKTAQSWELTAHTEKAWRKKEKKPGHMQPILRSFRNVTIYSTLFFLILSTVAQQCHLHNNNAQSSCSPRQTTQQHQENLTKTRDDETPNFSKGKLWDGAFSTYPAPLTWVARFPMLCPRSDTRTHTLLLAVCASAPLFLFGIVSRCPASFPCQARASRKSCSALTWITKATAARAVSPAVFRFGCGATVRRPDALETFQGSSQDIHDKTTSVMKKFTLFGAFVRTG